MNSVGKEELKNCRDPDIALVYRDKDLFNKIKICCYISAVTIYVIQSHYNACAHM